MEKIINNKTKYILININYLVFSIHTIFAKLASEHTFLSPKYLMYYAGALSCLMGHALLWQQTLKFFPLIKAYSWKGVIFIWAFVWSVFLFGEEIKWTNVIGSLIIVAGVLLVMKDSKANDRGSNV